MRIVLLCGHMYTWLFFLIHGHRTSVRFKRDGGK